MSGKLPKQFKAAEKASTRDGWTWEKTSRHVTVRDADGEFVVCISTTMYDGPTTRKINGKLRRAGCPGVPQQ